MVSKGGCDVNISFHRREMHYPFHPNSTVTYTSVGPLTPVSYTHLDVYKRQVWWGLLVGRNFNFKETYCFRNCNKSKPNLQF